MSLKSAKAELKSKELPIAFTPRHAASGMVAVNVNERDAGRVAQIMTNHGYTKTDVFYGIDTDYQICFKPAGSR